jgi:hypothetical protein
MSKRKTVMDDISDLEEGELSMEEEKIDEKVKEKESVLRAAIVKQQKKRRLMDSGNVARPNMCKQKGRRFVKSYQHPTFPRPIERPRHPVFNNGKIYAPSDNFPRDYYHNRYQKFPDPRLTPVDEKAPVYGDPRIRPRHIAAIDHQGHQTGGVSTYGQEPQFKNGWEKKMDNPIQYQGLLEQTTHDNSGKNRLKNAITKELDALESELRKHTTDVLSKLRDNLFSLINSTNL